jgi:hypothetical protein
MTSSANRRLVQQNLYRVYCAGDSDSTDTPHTAIKLQALEHFQVSRVGIIGLVLELQG